MWGHFKLCLLFLHPLHLIHCPESYFEQIYCWLQFLLPSFILSPLPTWEWKELGGQFFFHSSHWSLGIISYFMMNLWLLEQEEWTKWIKIMNENLHPLKHFPVVRFLFVSVWSLPCHFCCPFSPTPVSLVFRLIPVSPRQSAVSTFLGGFYFVFLNI